MVLVNVFLARISRVTLWVNNRFLWIRHGFHGLRCFSQLSVGYLQLVRNGGKTRNTANVLKNAQTPGLPSLPVLSLKTSSKN